MSRSFSAVEVAAWSYDVLLLASSSSFLPVVLPSASGLLFVTAVALLGVGRAAFSISSSQPYLNSWDSALAESLIAAGTT